jgi:signal transduction histidine kinase
MTEPYPVPDTKRDEAPLVVHIDDRETNRYTVRRFLENAGFIVEQAATGKEGLELIERSRPGVIILDVKLPDMSGFDVCRQIKTNPLTSSIPVLHVSAHFTDSEARVEGLDAGADAYLTSISPHELIATVRALLRARHAEERATARAAEWQMTFDSVSDPIFIINAEGKILQSNTAGEQLLACAGVEERELLKEQLVALCVHETNASSSNVQELRFCSRIFRARVDRVARQEEGGTNCICVLVDVTETQQAQHEIRRMNDQLVVAKDAAVQANRAKSAFLASMSHELRTPLNAIIGYTEILQEDARGRGDEVSVQDLGRINHSAKHLLEMISEILDLSRIEAGRTKLNLDSFDPIAVVEEAISMVRPLANQKGNAIEVVGTVGGIIWSDGAKLNQILLNLLSNACKFTNGGKVVVRVARLMEGAKEWVRFEVSDTGI